MENNIDGGSLNAFLNDLYKQKVKLTSTYSVQEINDIRTAVDKQVFKLARTIGDIDHRLKVQQVIPVGSAQERTQVVRPCEYDYILVHDALSKTGAVIVSPTNPETNNRFHMNVKVANSAVRSLFNEIIDNDSIRAYGLLPWSRRGLRDLFQVAVTKGINQHADICVEKQTGFLTFKRSKPKRHGPACTVELTWNRNNTDTQKQMKISVDLCLAFQLEWDSYKDIFTADGVDVSDSLQYIQRVGSVMIMADDGMRFKVAVTMAELRLTEGLSAHHMQCYKLLKYVVNGEPKPFQTIVSEIASIIMRQGSIPSHTLKALVWYHHYTQNCSNENDLGICCLQMLSTMLQCLRHEIILTHPFNKNGVDVASNITDVCSVHSDLYPPKHMKLRIEPLIMRFKKVHKTPMDQYNFETSYRIIGASGFFGPFVKYIVHIVLCSLFPSMCAFLFFYDSTIEQLLQHYICFYLVGSILMESSTYYINYVIGQSRIERRLFARFNIACVKRLVMCICTSFFLVGLTFFVKFMMFIINVVWSTYDSNECCLGN